VPHLSAYSLIVEEGTPMAAQVAKGEAVIPDDEAVNAMQREAVSRLAAAGYGRYEISNYARSVQYECRHNKVYWNRGNYLGLGIGAASMVDNVRWSNIRDIDEYLRIAGADRMRRDGEADFGSPWREAGTYDEIAGARLGGGRRDSGDLGEMPGDRLGGLKADAGEHGENPGESLSGLRAGACDHERVPGASICNQKTEAIEQGHISGTDITGLRENVQVLSVQEQMEEFMFLGLRLVEGISIREFRRYFDRDIFEVYGDVIDRYAGSGHLIVDGDHLRLSDSGLDVSNTVMADFLF
jgi:coproporphyrinogen III oxidase-like Fe-S oxidoreductase